MDTPAEKSNVTPRRPLGKRLVRIAVLVLISYLVVLAVMMSFENSLIFFPLKYPEGNWHPQGLAFEDAHFEADGLPLHGWYVEAPNRGPSCWSRTETAAMSPIAST